MSLATLKRKTQTKYNNMSVGTTTGFSLNGTRRSQGYVGQTSLSRTIIKTPHNGTVPRGHGGTNGEFIKTIRKNSTINCLNDSSVVKSSSMGTTGMMMTRYKWIRRPQPYTTVKPDVNNNTGSQSQQIQKVSQKTQQSLRKSECNIGTYTSTCANSKTPSCVVTQPSSTFTSITAGEYLSKLKDSCVNNDKTFAKNTQNTPFGAS